MITRALVIIPLVVSGWIGLLAGMMLLTDDAPGALVLFPAKDFLARAPEGTAILSSNAFSITVTGDTENFARTLYDAGGLLVLPAGLTGCIG